MGPDLEDQSVFSVLLHRRGRKPFFAFSAEQTLESIHEIDVVVRGEGEITFLELAQRIAAKKDYSDIEGISYRGRGKIHHNPERAPEFQIDKFQIVDEAFDSVVNPTGNYSPFLTLRNYEKEDIKALSIHVGRGCPGKCVFCLYNKKRYRARSVDSVLDEIKNKMERFDCHAFHLDDPHLLKRSSFIVDFCNRIIDEKLEIIWYAETRADIDLGLLPLMRKAGCISLDFAIESASPKVIKAIRKNIRIEQAERLIEACRENRIKIKLFTMISLPDETEEDAQLTIDFLKKHKDHITNFSGGITRIYPGSELEEMAYSRKILPPDFSWYDRTYKNPFETAIHCQNVPIWMEHLSPKRIMELKKEVDFIISERKYTLSYIFLLIKKQMGPFLLNWNISEIKIKRKTLANFFKIVRYKIEEMLRTP